jgi:hypothetical protein
MTTKKPDPKRKDRWGNPDNFTFKQIEPETKEPKPKP